MSDRRLLRYRLSGSRALRSVPIRVLDTKKNYDRAYFDNTYAARCARNRRERYLLAAKPCAKFSTRAERSTHPTQSILRTDGVAEAANTTTANAISTMH